MSFNDWKSRNAPFRSRAPWYYAHECARDASLRTHTRPWADDELLRKGGMGLCYDATQGDIWRIHRHGQSKRSIFVSGAMVLAIADGWPRTVRSTP